MPDDVGILAGLVQQRRVAGLAVSLRRGSRKNFRPRNIQNSGFRIPNLERQAEVSNIRRCGLTREAGSGSTAVQKSTKRDYSSEASSERIFRNW